jgi:outer membrane protein TolC
MMRSLVLLLLMAGVAEAEPLTLEAALARAEDVSLAVQLQALSSEAAEARWLADPRAGAPSLRLGARDIYPSTAADPNPDPPEVTTRLRFPLPRPWDLDAANQQGLATVAREDAELEGIKARVRLAVVRRFHALPLLNGGLTTAEALVARREDQRSLVEQRRAEGLATALDWLTSEDDHRNAADLRASWAARVEEAEAELRLLLQWPEEEPLELDVGPVSTDLVEPADQDRPSPDVLAADAEVARSRARLHRDQLRSLPWLDWVQGGVLFRPDGRVGFDVGIAVDIPVYFWSPARTRAARQEYSAAQLEREQMTARDAQRQARRLRLAQAAHERWQVETAHRDAVQGQAEPLLELAEPVLRVELASRMLAAELRVLAALVELVDELDRLDEPAP